MSRLVVESRQGRRLIGEFSTGDDLLSSLLAICHDHHLRCAVISVTGVLDEVSLGHYDRASRGYTSPRVFRGGALQMLHASGNLSEEDGKLVLQLSLVASRLRDNGIEVLGGLCMGGKVIAGEFVIEAMDDVILRRSTDKNTGLHPWTKYFAAAQSEGVAATTASDALPPRPEALQEKYGAPAVIAAKPSWADVVTASARAEAQQEAELQSAQELEKYPIRAGDIIEHHKFGKCVVEKVDSHQEYVTVRVRNNRQINLSLEVLNLRYQGEQENCRTFLAPNSGGHESRRED